MKELLFRALVEDVGYAPLPNFPKIMCYYYTTSSIFQDGFVISSQITDVSVLLNRLSLKN